MKTLSLFMGLTLISGMLAQQPSQSEPPDAKKLGSLEGRVVNSKTGEPIRRVNLTLRPFGAPGISGTGPMPAQAAPYAAATDAEGKFRINNVEPGSYQMTAERQGFVRSMYGAGQNPMMGGVTLKVTDGQELRELNFKLIPQAVITGRVLDEEGEPLARVQIQVLRRRFFQGKSQLMPSGGGQTTDTGEFRVSELAPGKYWVNAIYRGRMMMFEAPARNTGDKPEEEYVTTYYPGSTEQAAARPIELEAGQEMPGMDIRMQKARVYRIRGKVIGSGPQSLRNLRLMVLPRERTSMMGFMGGPGAPVKEDGSFEIGYVQAGSYFVTAMPQGPQSAVGKVAVDVTRDNVENVTLTLGGGAALTGSVRVDGNVEQLEKAQGRKLTFGSLRVQLMPVEGTPFNVPNSTPKEDGSFVIENVGPEKYRVGVFGLPPGTWLKSIRAGDQEVLDTGIDATGGAAGPIQITLGTGVGQIGGLVRDAKQQPVSGGLVSLLPDPMKEDRNDLYRTATADQNGQFTMQNIPPGDYKLFAWADIEPGSHMDPEFVKPHDSKAEKITIKPNSQQNITLVQIPPDVPGGR